MFDKVCVFTVVGEDEIAFVELIEEGVVQSAEDFFVSQGFSVHIETLDEDLELQLLQSLS